MPSSWPHLAGQRADHRDRYRDPVSTQLGQGSPVAIAPGVTPAQRRSRRGPVLAPVERAPRRVRSRPASQLTAAWSVVAVDAGRLVPSDIGGRPPRSRSGTCTAPRSRPGSPVPTAAITPTDRGRRQRGAVPQPPARPARPPGDREPGRQPVRSRRTCSAIADAARPIRLSVRPDPGRDRRRRRRRTRPAARASSQPRRTLVPAEPRTTSGRPATGSAIVTGARVDRRTRRARPPPGRQPGSAAAPGQARRRSPSRCERHAAPVRVDVAALERHGPRTSRRRRRR